MWSIENIVLMLRQLNRAGVGFFPCLPLRRWCVYDRMETAEDDKTVFMGLILGAGVTQPIGSCVCADRRRLSLALVTQSPSIFTPSPPSLAWNGSAARCPAAAQRGARTKCLL